MWGLAAALAAGIGRDPRMVVVLAVLVAAVLVQERRSPARVVALALAFTLFFLYGYTAVELVDRRQTLVRQLAPMGEIAIEGWVASFPSFRYGRTSFILATHQGTLSTRLLVRAPAFAVAYGDSVRVRGKFRRDPRDGPVRSSPYMAGIGVAAEFRVKPGGFERVQGENGRWIRREVLWPIHDRARRELCKGLGTRAGVPLALLLGERGHLDRRTQDAFVRLGASHLLALSGLHLGMVAGTIIFLLRVVGCHSGFLVLAFLALYTGVVGSLMSLSRAFIMATLLIVATGLRRPARPLTALASAFVVMLLLDPSAYFSLSFQMSFVATLAVLLCVARLQPPKHRTVLARARFALQSSLLVSLSAQLWIVPVAAAAFGRVSVLSPIATIVLLLPVALMLGAAAACTIVAVFAPGAGAILFDVLGGVSAHFEQWVQWTSLHSPGPVALSPPPVAPYYAGLALWWWARGRRRVRIVAALAVVVSLAIALLPA